MSQLDNTFNKEFSIIKKDGKIKNKMLTNFSLDNIYFSDRNIRINSPTSLTAMKGLGNKISDLEYIPFKEYVHKNQILIGKNKKTQQIIYSHIQNLRHIRLQKNKDLSKKSKSQNNLEKSKGYFSHYNLRNFIKNKSDLSNSMDISKIISKEREKEKKELERVININNIELANRIKLEIQRELLRKKDEEKIKKQKIKYQNYQLELNKKKEIEEFIKLKKGIESQKKQEELELSHDILNLQKHEKEILKSKNSKNLEKQRKKELKLKSIAEIIHRLLFKKKKEEFLEDRKFKIIERAKSLELKGRNKRKQIKIKNKIQQKLNLEKEFEKKIYIQQKIRDHENKIEQLRKQYEIKEKQYKDKKKLLVKISKKEYEKKIENDKKKEEEIKLALEKNKEIKQQQIYDFYKKQKNLERKRKILEKNNELIRLEKLKENEEKVKKIKENLNINNKLLSQRREQIINEIKLKEYKTQQIWKEKLKNLEKIEDYNLSKSLEKKFKIEEAKKQKLDMINNTKMQLEEKDKKIEYFLKQKNKINRQKKLLYKEFNERKKFYTEKVQNYLKKNTLNKKTIKEIKNIFSNSQEISNVINKYNQLMKDNED